MSVTEAARVYEEAKRQEQELKARLEQASAVLKTWFHEHPDKRDYRSRIGFAVASRTQLDTAAVKAELGDRLSKFQRTVTYEQLSLLKSG